MNGGFYKNKDKYPQAILHIDGDAFFASCEVASRPHLKGKPVVVGKERGIASALTYEAKALGITRGMSVYEIRKKFPQVKIFPSDYETYSLYSKRMFDIVRKFTPQVEEYSIDECFADLTGLRGMHKKSYQEIATNIKEELQKELGVTFSVGLSVSKVLSKIASKYQKPDGLTFISFDEKDRYLKETLVENLWGIGKQTKNLLNKFGIYSALDFSKKEETWVRNYLNKPYYEIWRELNGEKVYEVKNGVKRKYKSISKTKTFTPASEEKDKVFSELSKNIENACIKARRHNLAGEKFFCFIKSNDFKYQGFEFKLTGKSNTPTEIIGEAEVYFDKIFNENTLYRSTGVVMKNLEKSDQEQLDLFRQEQQRSKFREIFKSIDLIDKKFGKHSVFIGSSLLALTEGGLNGERGERPERVRNKLEGETERKHLGMPFLGPVK